MSSNEDFGDIVNILSRKSKCVSMKVGCIAVNERGRIVSSGVNGTISGGKNCCDVHAVKGNTHSAWSQKYEIHAEMNCILELARSSGKYKSLTFYTTHSPCDNCLKHLMGMRAVGELNIVAIVFNERYDKVSKEELDIQKAYCLEFGVLLVSNSDIQ